MKIFSLLFFIHFSTFINGQNNNRSLTYFEVISEYKKLDSLYNEAKLIKYGSTDCGEHLYLFVLTNTGNFNPVNLHEQKKCILFINNGIHPGEPDGIDASLKLANDLLSQPLYKKKLDNVVVCIIPVFNIDGSLERNKFYRVNQNGPEECGFRANSKNLDLNRDFIKTDALNTKSLITILREWDPDVFIDTHVSNGADYQHTMTLISSQHNKLNPFIGSFMHDVFSPSLFEKMKNKNDEMIPYVHTIDGQEIPDSGIAAFLETPRYASGYMSLFNCFSFISEAHMLKPFYERMNSTYNILLSVIELCEENRETIIDLRKKANESDLKANTYYFNFKLDKTKKTHINFKGYKADYKPSKVTGKDRLYYDRTRPFNKKIPFYDEYIPSDSVNIPKHFVIPLAWTEIISLLKLNGVEITSNENEYEAECEVYYIEEYKTVSEPFEGHYLHYNVKTRSEVQKIKINKGDFLVKLPQKNMRYIMETLNPRAFDSFFCWGFFDSFLQQKEWFSPYLFEETADSLLKNNEEIKTKFETWKSANPNADDFSQLNFIYQNSPYFEKSYRRYPVFSLY